MIRSPSLLRRFPGAPSRPRSGTRRRRRPGALAATLVALLLAALALGACGDSSTDPEIGAPEAVVVLGGDLQQDTIDAILPTPLSVEVVDSAGTPLPDVEVDFKITAGTGSLSPPSTTTDARGRARATWKLGKEAGEQKAEARAAGASPGRFTATAVPGAVAQVVLSRSRVTLPAAESLTVDVGMVDRRGNAVLDRAPPTWSASDPGVVSTATVPDSAGARRILGLSPGSATLVARAGEVDAALAVDVVDELASRRVILDDDGFLIADADGTDKKVLPTGEEPAWGPHGERMAIVRGKIYVVELAVGAEERRWSSSIAEALPSWSPGGDSIAFLGGRSVGFGEYAFAVYRAGLDGGEPVRLTEEFSSSFEGRGGFDGIAWSPTGERIAYVRGGELYVVSVDGGEASRVTPPRSDPTVQRYVGPRWSPDGSWVALEAVGFTSGGAVQIRINRPTSTAQRVLGEGRHPTWHPDGNRVTAVRDEGGEAVLASYSLSDGAWSDLGAAVGPERVGPLSWSPDGALLLYGVPGGVEGEEGMALAAVSVDGSWSRILATGEIVNTDFGPRMRVGHLIASGATWTWVP